MNSDQFLEWYKKNYNKSFAPSTGLTRQEGMSDKDWALGSNLYKAYMTDQQLSNQYNVASKALQQEKQTSLETADILNQRLMKYLPIYNKAMGLGGGGATETAAIQAQANYMNTVSGINRDIGNREQQLLDAYRTGQLNLWSDTADREMDILSRYADIEREQQQQKRLEEQQQMQLLASLQANVERGAIDKISLDEYLNAGAIEENDYNRLLDMYRTGNFENIQSQIDAFNPLSDTYETDVKNIFNLVEEQKKAGEISKEQYNDIYRYYYEAIIPYANNIEEIIANIQTSKTRLGANYESVLAKAEARKKELEKQRKDKKIQKDIRVYGGSGQTANVDRAKDSFWDWLAEALRNTKPSGY